MGMDVMGVEPKSEVGSYFRNNVWWWRPLWNYCCEVSPEARSVKNGHTNDGDGLDSENAKKLAQTLLTELGTGRTKKYETEYRKQISELPMQPCDLCNSTGIRTDEVGLTNNQDIKKLSPEQQALYGRTRGWCNGCDGAGEKPPFATQYPFSVENVQEFAEFLIDCGGFEIC